MKPLLAAVIGMGLVILLMVGTIAVTLVHRMGSPVGRSVVQSATLRQPAGTRMAGIATLGDRLAVLMQGGGPDRVVLLDAAGQVVGTVTLAP